MAVWKCKVKVKAPPKCKPKCPPKCPPPPCEVKYNDCGPKIDVKAGCHPAISGPDLA
jgi:hypothetical protein